MIIDVDHFVVLPIVNQW